MLGRGRGLQHRARAGSLIPIIGMDYFSLTSAGVMLKKELKLKVRQIDELCSKASEIVARARSGEGKS